MERSCPVAIEAIGGATATTVTWARGRLRYVTAVVKATFAFVPSGAMASVAAEPIFAEDQEGPPDTGLRAADDLAPFLGQADVCLTGHAPAPLVPSYRVRVRLAILRDGGALLDKAIDLQVPPGSPRPIPIAGMGPISRRWPIRRRLLGATDPRRVDGSVLDIPEPFDWGYFQASPADQRTAALRGDEWLLLEGVHPTLERLMTQLPGARGEARLYAHGARTRPFDLRIDALRIDVDRRRCSLVWRGHLPVAGDLASLRVVAGVELPGRALPWPAEEAPAAHDPLGGTIVMGDEPVAPAFEALLGGTIVMGDEPAAPSIEADADEDPLAGTLGLDESTAAQLFAKPATPFREGSSSLSSPFTRAQPAPRPPDEDPLAGTLGLDESTTARLPARPATPFLKDAPAPPPARTEPEAHDPLAGTLGLDESTAAQLLARPAMPFRRDLWSPLSLASSPASARAESDRLGSTLALDEDFADALGAWPATPFEQAPLPAPAAGEAPVPEGLGAQFLFAIAAIERRAEISA